MVGFARQFAGVELAPSPKRTVRVHAIRAVGDKCIATTVVTRMAPQEPPLRVPRGESTGIENRRSVPRAASLGEGVQIDHPAAELLI